MPQVEIPERMKRFLEEQAIKEGFKNASEYLKSIVSEFQQRKELEEKLLEGIRSAQKSWMNGPGRTGRKQAAYHTEIPNADPRLDARDRRHVA